MASNSRSWLSTIACGATVIAFALPASGYPGGTPDFQTDVTPFCAACHSSTSPDDLAMTQGDRATKELAANKHYASVTAGEKTYADLSEADRAKLVELLKAVDANSKIELDFPPQVAPGETFQVTVRLSGGAGPVVATGLVDRPHRWFAKPASTAGWTIVGAPSVIGPDGQPQREWLGRRPERVGRNVTFVNLSGWRSDVTTGTWASGKVIYTMRAPDKPGDYPLAAFFLYGTEKAIPLSTKSNPMYGDQPLGGYAGKSGRVRFTAEQVITVK